MVLMKAMPLASLPLSIFSGKKENVTFYDENMVFLPSEISSYELTIRHSASILGMPGKYSVGRSLDEELVWGCWRCPSQPGIPFQILVAITTREYIWSQTQQTPLWWWLLLVSLHSRQKSDLLSLRKLTIWHAKCQRKNNTNWKYGSAMK